MAGSESKEWFLYVVDHHEGPFTPSEIKKLVKNGDALHSSYVWKEGYADWVMMSDVTEFGVGGPKSDGHGPASFVTHDMGGVSSSASVWCLNARKAFTGPHSMKHIVRKVNEGEILVTDTVWKEGWTSFVPISNIPEFMQTVKPDVLQKGDKKAKGVKVALDRGGAAAAMGMGGGPATRVYKWYKSRNFFIIITFMIILGVYQALTLGHLDPVLEKANLKEKVKAIDLAPLPFDRAIDFALSLRESAAPLFVKVIQVLPEQAQGWLMPLPIPDGLNPNDVATLRETAIADIKQGARVVTALPLADEANPAFALATNLPEGASFVVILRGREGTLLNAFSYEKLVYVDVTKHIGRTQKFSFEGNKPLPKGEYTLIVYEADKQSPEVMAILAAVPQRAAPASVPKGKVAFVVDSYFLGGKKDATYPVRLKEFNERVKARLSIEAQELKQMALTLESIANESATKFFDLAKGAKTPQRSMSWRQYDAKYLKISGQIKAMLNKTPPDVRRKDFVLPHLYDKLAQTYELTERLHQAETAFIERGGQMDEVKSQAARTAESLNDLKQAILKVIK